MRYNFSFLSHYITIFRYITAENHRIQANKSELTADKEGKYNKHILNRMERNLSELRKYKWDIYPGKETAIRQCYKWYFHYILLIL